MSNSTGIPPASAIASACWRPRNPAPPVITATRSVKLNRFFRSSGLGLSRLRCLDTVTVFIALLITPGLSAIHHHAGPGHEGGSRGGDKSYDIGNLFGGSEPLHRNGLADVSHDA